MQTEKSPVSIGDLMQDTEANLLAIDLATDKHLTPPPKTQCYKRSNGVYGPLPSGTVEMIWGRTGFISQGLYIQEL